MISELYMKYNIEDIVEKILARTARVLRDSYNEAIKGKHFIHPHKWGRLIFPVYSRKQGGNIRISEQELRFVFANEFNNFCEVNNCVDLFYSVETPTEDSYTFSENGKKINPIVGRGQSGNFDFTIYMLEKGRYIKIALIEFKAGNISTQAYKEVESKLYNRKEGSAARFLIHLVEDDISKTTNGNYDEANKWIEGNNDFEKIDKVNYWWFTLKEKD